MSYNRTTLMDLEFADLKQAVVAERPVFPYPAPDAADKAIEAGEIWAAMVADENRRQG
jgi:hypothetical protein